MRGKQYELAALREVAPRLSIDKVCPIIEPVKSSLKQLTEAVLVLNGVGIVPHIVVNPEVGELTDDSPDNLYNSLIAENIVFVPCIRLYNQNVTYAQNLLNNLVNEEKNFSLYIQEDIQANINRYTSLAVANIILDQSRYSYTFANALSNCVIIDSSFPAKKRNSDYSLHPKFFSDAHLTYTKPLVKNQIGFGDYLTINSVWSESGGPAFVIAVHITYLEHNQNMYVKHSLSVTSPNDQSIPAVKFQEALSSMIQFANKTPSLDQNTLGFQEYINIHNRQSYHGLGIPKKLSMMHHIETMNNYL